MTVSQSKYNSWSRRIAVASLLVSSIAQGFSPSAPPNKRTTSSSFALHLLPEQGSQLAAAWNAAHAPHQPEDYFENDLPTKQVERTITATSAARAFVSRLFHLPSQLHLLDRQDDVVIYPVVGFRFVKCSKNDYRVLPTQCAASCRVPTTNDEEVVGWYSPGCPLDKGPSSESKLMM